MGGKQEISEKKGQRLWQTMVKEELLGWMS